MLFLRPPHPLLLLLQNQFDSIDLSDNSIVRLEGFPKLPRLQCLHLSNNRINRIARNLEGERAACSRQAVGLVPAAAAVENLPAACMLPRGRQL